MYIEHVLAASPSSPALVHADHTREIAKTKSQLSLGNCAAPRPADAVSVRLLTISVVGSLPRACIVRVHARVAHALG